MTWSADLRQPAGQRITLTQVGGRPLETGRTYRVVSHAGMLAGLHRYTTFAAGRDIQRQERKVSDAVTAAFRKAGTVRAPAIGDAQLIKADQR